MQVAYTPPENRYSVHAKVGEALKPILHRENLQAIRHNQTPLKTETRSGPL
jgi:hypothetical protein